MDDSELSRKQNKSRASSRHSKKSSRSGRSSSKKHRTSSRKEKSHGGSSSKRQSSRKSKSSKRTSCSSKKISSKKSRTSHSKDKKSSRRRRDNRLRERADRLNRKLEEATMEKRRIAAWHNKLAGIMHGVMVGIVVLCFMGVIVFTVVPYLKLEIDTEFWYHIVQIVIELILLSSSTFVLASRRLFFRDLHTSLLICAASWNLDMVSGTMRGPQFAEVCSPGGYDCILREVTMHYHLAFMNLFALVCHVIATLLSIAAGIFVNNCDRQKAEIESSFRFLATALKEDRIKRSRDLKLHEMYLKKKEKRKQKKSQKSSSRRTSSKKSSRSTKSHRNPEDIV